MATGVQGCQMPGRRALIKSSMSKSDACSKCDARSKCDVCSKCFACTCHWVSRCWNGTKKMPLDKLCVSMCCIPIRKIYTGIYCQHIMHRSKAKQSKAKRSKAKRSEAKGSEAKRSNGKANIHIHNLLAALAAGTK